MQGPAEIDDQRGVCSQRIPRRDGAGQRLWRGPARRSMGVRPKGRGEIDPAVFTTGIAHVQALIGGSQAWVKRDALLRLDHGRRLSPAAIGQPRIP